MEPNEIQKEFGVDVNSPIYNERLLELDKTLESVIDTLDNLTDVDMRTIREEYFQHIFLPIFLGETTVSHGATLTTWIGIAGGHYNSVKVVDNTDGRYLFTVPPLFQRNVISSNIQRSANISDIMSMAKKHHELAPARGDAYRLQGLYNALESMRNSEQFLTNFNEWNTIFKRYGKGYDVEIKNNSVALSNDTNQHVKNNDEFEYD